ncbi:MAG: hypothetical protein H6557_07880 [Lewinellaceae bacterium]|nr:hypothetical protein [Phaeodactylibacter sp.]MCB9036521.1 hypothetical protein [Lewinellaceae bacterium]
MKEPRSFSNYSYLLRAPNYGFFPAHQAIFPAILRRLWFQVCTVIRHYRTERKRAQEGKHNESSPITELDDYD